MKLIDYFVPSFYFKFGCVERFSKTRDRSPKSKIQKIIDFIVCMKLLSN